MACPVVVARLRSSHVVMHIWSAETLITFSFNVTRSQSLKVELHLKNVKSNERVSQSQAAEPPPPTSDPMKCVMNREEKKSLQPQF